MVKIFYNKQYIDNSDKKSVVKVLGNKLITGGKSVSVFEEKLKKYLKVKFASTCINGTAALHMAFEAIKLKRGEVVIMPVINFVASYNMATLYGAKTYFADVDHLTGQMTPETLVKCIKKNNLKKIKAVVTMYMGGYPENSFEFYKLKFKYKFLIIEDACHAFGSNYFHNNKKIRVGSCLHSDLCTFSFHPVKSITTGEGGLITTNKKPLFKRIEKFANHNISRGKKYWDYEIYSPGFNYRLSDINCALGISQLKKINFFITKRKKIYKIYKKELQKFDHLISSANYEQKNHPSYHLIIFSINFKYLKTNKDIFIKYMNSKKIYPQFHYKPIIQFKYLKKKGNKLKNFEGAKKYFTNNISLPIYVNMEQEEVFKIINTLKSFFKKKLPSSRINNI